MRRYKRHCLVAEINVVPYIDVMLVLLVIFMVTAPMLFQGVEVNLPTSNAKAMDSKQKEPIVLSIDQSGNYYLNIAPNPTLKISSMDITNLVQRELKNSKDRLSRPILIKGDRNISYEKIITAMTLLQQAGAPTIGLITNPENSSPRISS